MPDLLGLRLYDSTTLRDGMPTTVSKPKLITRMYTTHRMQHAHNAERTERSTHRTLQGARGKGTAYETKTT